MKKLFVNGAALVLGFVAAAGTGAAYTAYKQTLNDRLAERISLQVGNPNLHFEFVGNTLVLSGKAQDFTEFSRAEIFANSLLAESRAFDFGPRAQIYNTIVVLKDQTRIPASASAKSCQE